VVPDELSGGPYFAAFCERYLRHTKGRWSGRPLVFEDWQREFWWEALEVDPATGLRVYSEIGLGLPRKNGKSVMASAFSLYMLAAGGEPEPEVYAAAAERACKCEAPGRGVIDLGLGDEVVASPPTTDHKDLAVGQERGGVGQASHRQWRIWLGDCPGEIVCGTE
jgi:hypothetical protein